MERKPYNRVFPPVVSSATIIKVFILESLMKRNGLYGYEITKDLSDQFSDGELGWNPPSGQVYRMLREMEDGKFLKSEWEATSVVHGRPTRRLWYLTDEGRLLRDQVKEQNFDLIQSAIRTVLKVGVALYGNDAVSGTVAAVLSSKPCLPG